MVETICWMADTFAKQTTLSLTRWPDRVINIIIEIAATRKHVMGNGGYERHNGVHDRREIAPQEFGTGERDT